MIRRNLIETSKNAIEQAKISSEIAGIGITIKEKQLFFGIKKWSPFIKLLFGKTEEQSTTAIN